MRLVKRIYIKKLTQKHHLNHFNKRSLRRLLEQNNFKIINTYTTNYPIQAVDVPGDKFIYKVATYLIFKLSDINNTQILQTIICKKK